MQLIIESSDEKVLQRILELIRPFKVSYREVKNIHSNEENLIGIGKQQKHSRKLGIMPCLVAFMAPDFNEPLEDFERHPTAFSRASLIYF